MPAIIATQGQPTPATSQKDLKAIGLGYTRRVYIEGGCQEGSFLIKPDTDLDDRFKAWAIDWEEWVHVNGSTCLIEDEECGA